MKNKKIIGIILGIIILLGIVMGILQGFQMSLEYGTHKKITISLSQDINLEHINEVAKEVFEQEEFKTKKVGVFQDSIQIVVKECSDEQKQNLIQKLAEKEQIEENTINLQIINIPAVKLIDIVKTYILTGSIIVLVTLIYMTIVYRKRGILNSVINIIGNIIIFQMLLFSVLSITRILISQYTTILVIIVFIISIFVSILQLEKMKDK